MSEEGVGADWIPVTGTVIRGHGVASGSGHSPYPEGTVKMQKPFFESLGLELSGFHEGTLNLDIAPFQFRLVEPEHTFRRVEWTHLHPPEDFSFSRCRILHAGLEVDGWIYTPHPETKADHFQPPTMLEVLAPFLPGIAYGDEVILRVARGQVEVSPP